MNGVRLEGSVAMTQTAWLSLGSKRGFGFFPRELTFLFVTAVDVSILLSGASNLKAATV